MAEQRKSSLGEMDHYDFINAPQFVDFSDLSAQDDPDADKFFDAHREEDDFFVPLDVNAISPTVQLLYEEQTAQYSQEANKACKAAGLKDVNIEYYVSPLSQKQQVGAGKKASNSNNNSSSLYGTPAGHSGLSGSYYSPFSGAEDKENETPVPTPPLKTSAVSRKKTETPLGTLNTSQVNETDLIMAQLDHLLLDSSEEESPKKTPLSTKCSSLSTPEGPPVSESSVSCAETTVFKKSSSLDTLSSEDDDKDGSIGGSMELRSPVENILKILGDHEEEEENARCSIVVAPHRVGEQVHWTQHHEHLHFEEQTPDRNTIYDVKNTQVTTTLTNLRCSSVGDLVKQRPFETFGYNPRVGITIPKTPEQESSTQEETTTPPPVVAAAPFPQKMRRVSSCSDLIGMQQKLSVPGSGIPPRKMLTVPKTPDTLKRSQQKWQPNYLSSNQSSATSTASCGLGMRAKAEGKGLTAGERLAGTRTGRGAPPLKGKHYVSLAEAMIRYQKNTPDRFRSLPKGRVVPEKRAASCEGRTRRAAASPARSSPDYISVRGRSELSEKRAPNANNAAGPVLPKRVELKTTIPKPFNFSSGHRARPATAPKEELDFKFKARRAPSSTNHDPTENNANLLKSRPHIRVTQPLSPHFASDIRLKERHLKEAQKAQKSPPPAAPKKAKATPCRLPTATAPKPAPNHPVVVQPFSSSFEARQKEILRRKEEKIKWELEEEARQHHAEFHANPVPKFPPKLPKKKPVEVTHAQPFRLQSDLRGAAYQEQWRKKLEEEERELRAQVQFHAQSADVVHRAPFIPEHPTRLIENPSVFHLYTEKRAQERTQFEEQLRQKEREEEERRLEEQEKLEELQRQEDLERRRQMVHKAQPFKIPRPFQPKGSAKPLTVPQSPAFHALPSERRLKLHNETADE